MCPPFDVVVAAPASQSPPLPDVLADEPQTSDHADLQPTAALRPLAVAVPQLRIRAVRAGCWLINYTPVGTGLISYDGTIRVETHSAGRTASGDLYQRGVILIREPGPSHPLLPRPRPVSVLRPPPNPANGIPILSRTRYRYYLAITQILENFTLGNSFQLGFDMWRFTAPNSWVKENSVTAQMTWMTGPSGYPSATDYLEGDVKNGSGVVLGRLKMGWLSKAYRKAVVEIDTVSGCERPLDNGAGIGWQQVFDTLGWDVTIKLSDTNVPQASGSGWSDAEMHAAMLASRDPVSLDSEWRYHILSVKLIDSTPRGIMYDVGATDSDNVPREGVGIATNWVIPNTSEWGLVKGQRFGAAPAPFFRTAVHELGHAMGLYHTTVDNGFMNTTDVIAASATAANPFPNNIQWAYAAPNLKQLRHYPDPFVRPGGAAFGGASETTPNISPTDNNIEVPGLELELSSVESEIPLGAPARIDIRLRNKGVEPQLAPATLSLKTEFVRGWVRGPSDEVRTFRPLIICSDDQPMAELQPGGVVEGSLTLLRGAEGALFPSSGLYTVAVEARWEVGGSDASVVGSTTVLVTGAVNAAHAAAAHKVLATPDAHLVLILGGDHLKEGMEAIDTAVADPVLRPHFAVTEAKRLAQRFGKRAPQLKKAAAFIDKETVMSSAELGKLAKLASAAGDSAEAKDMKKTLAAKASGMDLTADAQGKLDAL